VRVPKGISLASAVCSSSEHPGEPDSSSGPVHAAFGHRAGWKLRTLQRRVPADGLRREPLRALREPWWVLGNTGAETASAAIDAAPVRHRS
jgi:hypothetical protein